MIKPKFRQGTWDADIFRGIVELNEYKIPNDLSNIKVIDIGGHIGSFSFLAAKNKAKEIFYCEALRENFDIGMEWINESFYKQKVKNSPVFVTFNVAVWKEDENDKLTFIKSSNDINTGGGSVMTSEVREEEYQVNTFPFDEMLRIRLYKNKSKEKVLLKLDCEGSEFPILFASKRLDDIDYICGEYHELYQYIPDIAKVEGYESYDVYTLQKFLKENGFTYTYFDRSVDSEGGKVNLGHFWASKTKDNFFVGIDLKEEYQLEI